MTGGFASPALSQLLAAFLRWWTVELAALWPARWRARVAAPQLTIRLSRDAVTIDRIADGVGERLVDPQPIEALGSDSWAELIGFAEATRPRLLLAPPDCFTTTLTLPKAARRRLNAAVTLQLGEIAPLEPSALHWAAHNVRVSGEMLTLAVTMIRRMHVEALSELFASRGMALPAIDAAFGETRVPIVAAAGQSTRLWQGRGRYWLIASALVASVPLTSIACATVLTGLAESRSDEIAARVAPKRAHDRGAHAAEFLRGRLAPLLKSPSASATLAALATRLPKSAWLHAAERRADGTLDLIVETAGDDDVRAALAGDPALPRLRLLDQAHDPDGGTRTHLAGRAVPSLSR